MLSRWYSVFFLSRLTCQILSLTDKHRITLNPVYIPTHLNVEADYLSQDQMLLKWHLLPQVAQAVFTFGAFQRWTWWHLLIPLNTTLFHIGISTISGGLRVECLQPSVASLGRLYVSSSTISSSGSVHVSGRTCQSSTQTFDSGSIMLDGGSLAPHSSQHVGRHSLVVHHHKRSWHGCFSSPSCTF